MDKVSMSHLISFSRYQTKCVIKFLFRQLMVYKFRIFLESASKVMADREKRGEDENTKIWISQERKELFRWNKKHFSVFEELLFGEKYKFDKK